MFRDVVLRSAGLWLILSLAVGQLTEEEKLTILSLHNKLRSDVQPSAAFMQKVVWNEHLRVNAESYASKCIWEHNPELEELKMGENLFVGTGQFNATKAVMDWFVEHLHYDYENNGCPDDQMCGHYTQMVWANSFKIGCATHLCDTLEHVESFKNATILVCNYFPAGNVEGQKPYESGDPCSKCHDELPVCESNICVPILQPTEGLNPTVLPSSPHVSTDPVIVRKTTQGHVIMSTESISVEEPTQGHVIIEENNNEIQNSSHGTTMRSVSAPLLILFWLTAAFVL